MKQKTMLFKNGQTTIVDAADEEALKALLDDGWTDSPHPKTVVDNAEAEAKAAAEAAEAEAKAKAEAEAKAAAEAAAKSSKKK